VQVVNVAIMCFSGVTEARHIKSGRVFIHLGGQNLRHILAQLGVVFLFVDHVKAGKHFGVGSFALFHVVEHLVDMVGNNLKSGDDELKLEVGNCFLSLFDALVNNLKLLHESHWLAVLVKKHSRNVSKLDNKDVLFNATVNSGHEECSEKRMELSKLSN
jgi:hypothetical protein